MIIEEEEDEEGGGDFYVEPRDLEKRQDQIFFELFRAYTKEFIHEH